MSFPARCFNIWIPKQNQTILPHLYLCTARMKGEEGCDVVDAAVDDCPEVVEGVVPGDLFPTVPPNSSL